MNLIFSRYIFLRTLLTIATGSLLRVAARLNFLTWVLVSRAFANSLRVGIGMFYDREGTES